MYLKYLLLVNIQQKIYNIFVQYILCNIEYKKRTQNFPNNSQLVISYKKDIYLGLGRQKKRKLKAVLIIVKRTKRDKCTCKAFYKIHKISFKKSCF